MKRNSPYAEGSAMCSSMKQPKPDRLVEIDGIPMTVHSADEGKQGLINTGITGTTHQPVAA